VEDAAALVGLSRSKFYQEMDKGTFPFVRVGRTRRIPRAWLENWVEEQVEAWEKREA